MSAGLRWRLPAAPDALRWHRWEDEGVARVQATGATHLLSPAATTVFETLQAANDALGEQQLLEALVAQPGDEDRAALAHLLHELRALGIVASVDGEEGGAS